MNFSLHSVCISGRKITFEVVSMQMLARSFEFLVESVSSLSDQLKVSLQLSHAHFSVVPQNPQVSTSSSQVSRGIEQSFGTARCPLQNHVPVTGSDCSSSHGLRGQWETKEIDEVCAGRWWGLRGGTCVVEHPCAAALQELEPCLLGHNFSKQVKVLRDHQAVNLNYGGGSWSLLH